MNTNKLFISILDTVSKLWGWAAWYEFFRENFTLVWWVCEDYYESATIWVLNDKLGLLTVDVLCDSEVLILCCSHWMISDYLIRVAGSDFKSYCWMDSFFALFNTLLNIIFLTLGKWDLICENGTNMILVVLISIEASEGSIWIAAGHELCGTSRVHTPTVEPELAIIVTGLVESVLSWDGSFKEPKYPVKGWLSVLVSRRHFKCGQELLSIGSAPREVACIDVGGVPVLPSQAMLSRVAWIAGRSICWCLAFELIILWLSNCAWGSINFDNSICKGSCIKTGASHGDFLATSRESSCFVDWLNYW